MGATALLGACAGDPGVPTAPDIVEIAVSPDELLVETSSAGTDPIQFEAWATYDDGDGGPLTLAEWTLSNRSVGTLDATGLFSPSTTNGGVTWVTAKLDGIVGLATVTVVYKDALNEAGIDPGLFGGSPTPISGSWLYPGNGVNVPRNTPSIAFQWADLGAEAYELRFRSELTDLTVYTTGTTWSADSLLWQTIASTNAGGTVQVDLKAVVAGVVYQEEPLVLRVNRMDATGSIIYWSTSVAGFREIPYGEAARDFLTSAQTGRCVGCHAISAHGQMAFTYDGGNGSVGVKWVADLSDFIPADTGMRYNFKTFSPDNRYMVGTYLGNLHLVDAETGAYIGQIWGGGDMTHVDWSPDGRRLVAVQTDGHTNDWTFAGDSRLVTFAHNGDGTFEAPKLLYTPVPGTKAYYPAFSPDGEWIAFNVSTGDGYDDPDATVWVIGATDYGGTGIRLDRANSDGQLTNSWPRWGPLPDDDVLWLAFASKRPYGHHTQGNPQLWVAAFDPAKARAGTDPSWPAFWLPNQGIDENNHIPVWVDP